MCTEYNELGTEIALYLRLLETTQSWYCSICINLSDCLQVENESGVPHRRLVLQGFAIHMQSYDTKVVFTLLHDLLKQDAFGKHMPMCGKLPTCPQFVALQMVMWQSQSQFISPVTALHPYF